MRASRLAGVGAKIGFMVLVYVFLLAPLVVVVGASLNGGDRSFFDFPPTNISLKWYGRVDPAQMRALGISLVLGVSTALGAAILGVPAAMGLVRARFRGKAVVAAILRSPLQIPAVVIGVSFLQMYYNIGNATGAYAAGTMLGLFFAHLFMVLPYVISAVSAVLERFNMRLEEAALSLGASRLSVFRRVTLPIIMPGIYTGCIYAFLVSFGDLPVSLFLAANGMATFPVEVFQAMEFDFNPAILATSSLIVVGSIVVMVALQRLVGMETLLRSSGGR
jgi:putative spermidine/putrescine transport system permease protein